MMIRVLLLFLVLFVSSCTSLDKEYMTHLENGLDTYIYKRDVNLNFVPGFSVKKIAFIKKNENKRMLVLRLNDDVSFEKVEKYSLAIKTYLDEYKYKDLLKDKDYISTPIKPILLEVGGYKYIATEYKLNVKRIKKIEFFLFHRDKFRKVLSKPIYVSNIGI